MRLLATSIRARLEGDPMNLASEKKREDVVDLVRAALPDVVGIYRFGSWTTPNEHAGSDVDLALLPAQPLDGLVRWELAQDLARLLKRDVDLVDLRAASTVLRAQVIAKGERLFCADISACDTFEDLAFSAYAHLNEARRGIL